MQITDKITITNEDNMALIARYPDNYFDLAIVDPPYGINADKKQNDAGKRRLMAEKGNKSGRGWKIYKETEWDSETPTEEYFKELFRVSKRQIIWGGNYFNQIWNYSNSFIIWNKKQREFSLADGELAWYSEKEKAVRIFDYSRGEALSDANKSGERIHPTQKPVALYKWLLDKYAKPNDKILDTHLGSGSIAIACHDYGYELTACELDKEYYDKAIQRIKNHVSQLKLF